MPARRRWMSWPWAGQASSNSSAGVQPRCHWGLGAAEPLGPAPAGVGSAREAGERCLLLWGPPHSLGLGAHQPCAGDVPKLRCSQEVAPSCGRGGSSGQCPQQAEGCCNVARRQAWTGLACHCWALASWFRPILFRNQSKTGSPEALFQQMQQGACF